MTLAIKRNQRIVISILAVLLFFAFAAPALLVLAASLIPGTPVVIDPASASYSSTATLDSTHVAVTYSNNDSGDAIVAICSISVTTPTCGTPVDVSLGSSGVQPTVAALDNSHIALAYVDGNFSAAVIAICSVSGTTPTCDTPVYFDSFSGNYTSAAALDSSHAAVAYVDTSPNNSPRRDF